MNKDPEFWEQVGLFFVMCGAMAAFFYVVENLDKLEDQFRKPEREFNESQEAFKNN